MRAPAGFIALVLAAGNPVLGQSIHSAAETDVVATDVDFGEAVASDVGHPEGSRFWICDEYLLWWVKATPVTLPALSWRYYSSEARRTFTSFPLGGEKIPTGTHHGGRFSLGVWLDDAGSTRLEGNFFLLGESSIVQRVDSRSFSGKWGVLGVPYYDDVHYNDNVLGLPKTWSYPPGKSLTITAWKDKIEGNHVLALSNRLEGFEINSVGSTRSSDGTRIDLLSGFRYVRFDEKYQFAVDSLVIDDGDLYGMALLAEDEFDASNRFYGAQIGIRRNSRGRKWTLNATGRIALGAVRQVVDVNGATLLRAPDADGGGMVLVPGAFMAQPTNMGRHSRSVFVVVPEVTLKASYQITRRLSLLVGYDFLYVSNVVRPGEQIDRVGSVERGPVARALGVDAPDGSRPAFAFNGSNLWAQGVNFGLEFCR